MDSLTGVLQAIVAPARGEADLQQLPRTMHDVTLGETDKRTQASVSNPRVTPINTTITPPIRRNTVGSPLSEKTPYGDELDEPHEKQQHSGSAQGSKTDLPVDSPNQEEEWPPKYPIAPQHCRRWGKPESYVVSNFSMRVSEGMRG
jgi:hypothetical protein